MQKLYFIRQGRQYWTVAISSLLQRRTASSVQVPIGHNEYRQLATAFMIPLHPLRLSNRPHIFNFRTLFQYSKIIMRMNPLKRLASEFLEGRTIQPTPSPLIFFFPKLLPTQSSPIQ